MNVITEPAERRLLGLMMFDTGAPLALKSSLRVPFCNAVMPV